MATKSVATQYPKISGQTWIWFVVLIGVLMVLYPIKALRPFVIMVIIIIAIGLVLRFSPQVVSQIKSVGGTKHG